jgi:cbb3-type cytochrome oxidase maturation protein
MIGIAVFFWAVRSKQFDDLDKEGFSILFNEKPASTTPPADSTPPSREP